MRGAALAGWLFSSVLVVACVGLGCARQEGPKTYPVRGKVSYRGQPVTSGLVLLTPQEQGHAATGELAADGTFALTTFRKHDGAVPGKYRVAIQVFPSEGAGLPGAEFGGKRPPIPPKYFTPDSSGLSAEIKAGDNFLDLALSD